MTKKKREERNFKIYGISRIAVIAFILALTMSSLLVVLTIVNRSNLEALKMEQIILEKSIRINEVVTRLLHKTDALSALVIQGNGEIENFERVAATIIDDPSILNVLIAPNGVVTNVYPLEGNHGVIGLDFFSEGAGNREAIMARDEGRLVFGGPFNLVQGGQALVGRLPVYTYNENHDRVFWGLVSVTMKYPQALDAVGLSVLETQGFAYEIWRINPDDDQRQVIATSSTNYNSNARFIEKKITIENAEWYFRVAPVREWYSYPETWVLIFCSLFISLLVGFIAQNNYELKAMKLEVEDLAQSDSLTNIYNRRYFMETAPICLDRSRRIKSECFIIIFDIDSFKQINDTYGHLAGDIVLIEVTARVKSAIRKCDILARYGGEEFIILACDTDETLIMEVTERIRLTISAKKVISDRNEIPVTASFGVAKVDYEKGLEYTIDCADKALYKAKESGKNKSIYFS